MIEYEGKIAGVIVRGDQLLYLLARPSAEELQIVSYGAIDLVNLAGEAQLLRGSKIICGVNTEQYTSKAIKTISGAITADPDSLLWELSHSCTERIDNYYFSFLNLLSNDNALDTTEVFGVKRRTIDRIGSLFEEHGLVLHKLVFEPEAIRQMLKKPANSSRVLFLLIEPELVHLQIYAGGRLIGLRALHQVDLESNSGRHKLTEEIGILLMSAPSANTASRELSLMYTGELHSTELAGRLARSLPYKVQIREIVRSDFELTTNDLSPDEFGRYYLPFSLAYLYNRELACASSPVKNEVWS
jgi:hypothetical protein